MTTKKTHKLAHQRAIRKAEDGLALLKKDLKKDPELKKYYEEEKLKYQVACQVREMRERLSLTQKDLAKLLKTSQSAIARLEDTDYEGNSIEKLQQVADALNCRLEIKLIKKVA